MPHHTWQSKKLKPAGMFASHRVLVDEVWAIFAEIILRNLGLVCWCAIPLEEKHSNQIMTILRRLAATATLVMRSNPTILNPLFKWLILKSRKQMIGISDRTISSVKTRSSATTKKQRVSYAYLSRLANGSCTSLNTTNVVQLDYSLKLYRQISEKSALRYAKNNGIEYYTVSQKNCASVILWITP